MSHRPLAIVSGLTIGDYLLWNWSLNGSHDVLALVSGLTLPPIAAAFIWLLALSIVRALARTTRPGQGRRRAMRSSSYAWRRGLGRGPTRRPTNQDTPSSGSTPAPASSTRSSRKIAA